MKRSLVGIMVAALAAFGVVGSASAGVVQLGFSTHYADGVAPDGSGPWLTATFTDVGPNAVRLNIVSYLADPAEHIKQINFNLDPALNGGDPSSLSFAQTIGMGPSAASALALANAFNAGPAKAFDMEFAWDAHERYEGGLFSGAMEVEFLISGILGLTAESFLFRNNDLGGPLFYGAAHVGGTGFGNEDSAWLGASLIPLPQTWLLLAVGLMLVPVLRYRFRLGG